MKGNQTIWASLVEAKTNILIGFGISYLANLIVLPLFGYPVGLGDAFGIALVFTVISLVRQFVIRRWFNSMKWGHK